MEVGKNENSENKIPVKNKKQKCVYYSCRKEIK